jgi:hypothetical protein
MIIYVRKILFFLNFVYISESVILDFKTDGFFKSGEDFLVSCKYSLNESTETFNYLSLMKDQIEFYRINNTNDGIY